MDFDEIGRVIAKRRKSLKITQIELAKSIGASRSRVTDLERGYADEIGMRKVIAMCEVLGLELRVVEKNKRPNLAELVEENKNA